MALLLCGFIFEKPSVVVDTENNHVYEYITSDEIISAYNKNTDEAKVKYLNNYYLVSGKIGEIAKNGSTFEFVGKDDKGITCSCPKELRSDVLSHKTNDTICAFGKITGNPLNKKCLLSVEKIDSVIMGESGLYFQQDGSKIDRDTMNERTLDEDEVKFYIPAVWKEVEHNIESEELGTIEGYQYVLNKLPGSEDEVPESFFVCYFDNESQLDNTDEKKKTKQIEKAIIDNISGEGEGEAARVRRNVSTYYGAKYDYYISSYTDAFNAMKNGYHVEYIFQRNGEEGFVIYLYVYKEPKHLNDVLFVTRFLEIQEP